MRGIQWGRPPAGAAPFRVYSRVTDVSPEYGRQPASVTPTTEAMVGIGVAEESTDMVLNIGPPHPSTHGVSAFMPATGSVPWGRRTPNGSFPAERLDGGLVRGRHPR